MSVCLVGVDPKLAWTLQGHFVSLSLSQFGCHVVQRVRRGEASTVNCSSSSLYPQILDEENVRATVVDELLSDQVFETLTCRNSIHVVSCGITACANERA